MKYGNKRFEPGMFHNQVIVKFNSLNLPTRLNRIDQTCGLNISRNSLIPSKKQDATVWWIPPDVRRRNTSKEPRRWSCEGNTLNLTLQHTHSLQPRF